MFAIWIVTTLTRVWSPSQRVPRPLAKLTHACIWLNPQVSGLSTRLQQWPGHSNSSKVKFSHNVGFLKSNRHSIEQHSKLHIADMRRKKYCRRKGIEKYLSSNVKYVVCFCCPLRHKWLQLWDKTIWRKFVLRLALQKEKQQNLDQESGYRYVSECNPGLERTIHKPRNPQYQKLRLQQASTFNWLRRNQRRHYTTWTIW